MERIFGWTSSKHYLSLGLLLLASVWGGTMWSRSQQPRDRTPDVVNEISHAAAVQPDAAAAAAKARLNEVYGRLPLSFAANAGQTDPQVDFISRGNGQTLFLTPREAVLALRAPSASPATDDVRNVQKPVAGTVVRIKFAGNTAKPQVVGLEELPGKLNYLVGNDPRRWATGIPTYRKVAYNNLYPGVDLIYYGNHRQLEYDFVVHPGVDPDVIALRFEGADELKVDAQGELVLHVSGGELRQRKPLIYQEVDGVRHEVAGSYQLKERNTVGFQLADYDASRPLVIDPVLVYSTLLGGGSSDQVQDITVDSSGSAYVTGFTGSSDFPTTVGAFDATHDANLDVCVTKLNPAGSALVYSTFLGGSRDDLGFGIAVDASGSAYVTGSTDSPDFPLTVGAFDTTLNGDSDVFVTKLNPTGAGPLVYSTLLGGIAFDQSHGIAVDTAGSAYVTGTTFSPNFPATVGAFDTTFNGESDAFVTKLNPSGTGPLVYSTFLGGGGLEQGSGIAVDASGSAYVTGNTFSPNFPTTVGAFDTTHNGSTDAFVTKLNFSGSAPLVYSTFVGDNGPDVSIGIAVDITGSAYITGRTGSPSFPTTVGAFDTTFNGVFDAFVTKLNPSGSGPLVYSTFLGGVDLEQANGIAVDISGIAYVTGVTQSPNFPTTVEAFDTTFNGASDVFVTKLNPFGSEPLVYSTFLGGNSLEAGLGIAVDNFGNAYVTGNTRSLNFPTTVDAFDTTPNGAVESFVAKISTAGFPASVTLNPPAGMNPVDSQHCVTATVQDASGNPSPNIVVRFQAIGSVNTFGSPTTDSNGKATFCYVGPPLPGADTITAYADTNNTNVQDPGEPSGRAEKTWVLPVTTPLCEITNGGWINAENGDRASFGGNAKATESGATQGQQQYQNHGPAQDLKLHSLNVLAIVCDGSTRASIFGQAAINGSGIINYRINVQDLGEPGRGKDTYLLLMEGYSSGEQTLRGGNIRIRRR